MSNFRLGRYTTYICGINLDLPSALMADATHTQVAMREQEDRLENRITSELEAWLIKITASVTSWSDITNLSNKKKIYDENLIYYTSLPKNVGNFKTFINWMLSQNP